MEQKKSTNNIIVQIVVLLTTLFIPSSCIGIRMDSEIDLGGGYYYVQDYPQCICRYPKPGNVVLPIGDSNNIVVRVRYNDSVIIATCSSSFHALDSIVYEIEKSTNSISIINDEMQIVGKNVFNEVRNHHRYREMKGN